MPLNSAGDAAHSANANWCLIAAQPVSFKFVTLKRKRASTFPYSWVSQWFSGFSLTKWVAHCLFLSWDSWTFPRLWSSHLVTDENYITQITLKVDKAISYRFWWRTHGFGSVSDISLRKRDIYLMQRAIIGFLRRWGRKISSALLLN